MVLLYVDALGMKARWASGSVSKMRQAYSYFEWLVSRALADAPPSGNVSGGVQSDAVALIFENPLDAVEVGRALFRLSFFEACESHRFWLRGLIVPTEARAEDLLSDKALSGFTDLYVRHFSDSLLQAINVEQRFKGPRLVLAADLVTKDLKNALAIPVGKRFVMPVRHLNYSPGPDREIAGPWWDVLYLLPPTITPSSISEVDTAVSQRMRWAANWHATPTTGAIPPTQPGSVDELAQLSFLSVMWAETQAIVRAVGLREGVFGPADIAAG